MLSGLYAHNGLNKNYNNGLTEVLKAEEQLKQRFASECGLDV